MLTSITYAESTPTGSVLGASSVSDAVASNYTWLAIGLGVMLLLVIVSVIYSIARGV